MTEPNQITFGGVKLNKNEIVQTSTKTLKNKYGKTEKYFVVKFKNGVEAAYRGTIGGEAYISSSSDVTQWNTTNIYGVMGLELKGNKKRTDFINIDCSSIKYVDVIDDLRDEVTVAHSCSDQALHRHNSPDCYGFGEALAGEELLGSGNIWTDRRDFVKTDDEPGTSIYGIGRINK